MRKKRFFFLPNSISLGRLLLIPAIVVLVQKGTIQACVLAAVLFLLAGLSDILDGLLARRRQSITLLGAFLDPLADKVLALSILITLIPMPHIAVWFAVPVMLILSCEIAVAAIQGIASAQKAFLEPKRFHYLRKIIRFFALFCLLLRYEYYGFHFQLCGLFLLGIATLIHLLSVVEYSIFFSRLQIGVGES